VGAFRVFLVELVSQSFLNHKGFKMIIGNIKDQHTRSQNLASVFYTVNYEPRVFGLILLFDNWMLCFH
jgi:hypothetical protein